MDWVECLGVPGLGSDQVSSNQSGGGGLPHKGSYLSKSYGVGYVRYIRPWEAKEI